MTPPEDTGQGKPAEASVDPLAVSHCQIIPIATLKNRPDFLRAASAGRQATDGFLLQARARDDGMPLVRVGYTASKKIGNSVLRNRAKRRLREIVRKILPKLALPGWDYVLVAKPGATVERSFALLLSDLESALRSVHRKQAARSPS